MSKILDHYEEEFNKEEMLIQFFDELDIKDEPLNDWQIEELFQEILSRELL